MQLLHAQHVLLRFDDIFCFSFWERHQSSGRACLFRKTTVIAQNAAALWAAVGCVAVGQGDSSHSYPGDI
jgi:hypothetical protein